MVLAFGAGVISVAVLLPRVPAATVNLPSMGMGSLRCRAQASPATRESFSTTVVLIP